MVERAYLNVTIKLEPSKVVGIDYIHLCANPYTCQVHKFNLCVQHVYIIVYMYMHVCTCSMSMCMCVCVHMSMHTCVYVCVCLHVCKRFKALAIY